MSDQPAAPPAQQPTTVRTEQAGAVATVILDRGPAMNALDTATKEQLVSAVTAVADDTEVRCVVLSGAGRAFCVGQDLREHAEILATGQLDRLWATVPEHYNPVAELLATMPKPVVASVGGVAAGAGASFAMAADIRLVAASAGFNLAFTGVGLSADSGATWLLPRLVGHGRAIDLLLRPRTVSAQEALEIGLATEVVADEDLEARTAEVAARLAAGPTAAFAAVRHATAFSWTHPLPESLDNESRHMTATGSTADHAAAVTAFLAKQRPHFEGR